MWMTIFILTSLHSTVCPHVLTQYDIILDKLRDVNTTFDTLRVQELIDLVIEYGEQTREMCDDKSHTALNLLINTTQEVSFSDDFGGYID